ncbi:MgtC/SapB family protein [Sinorhizobium meliloti]|uniref:MgtC/SapB family protein n=1 Tax=Rhizobium meliloti TaxID=382 RepID=UPI002380854A|nr:MgtC/SapB family protein [Sinorhizobium meliloti]MDE3876456.1 MgtC/SapB family protein [Sinorhizobium meliloti]
MEPLILRLGLALAIGLLVGLERGWREREAPAGSRTAGIRTYGISGLLGGIVAALSDAQRSDLIFAAGFMSFALSFTWFKLHEARHDEDFSVTGVIAGLAVFALGGLAVAGDYRIAAAGAAALAGVLASRELMHNLLKTLSWIELRSALVLAAMTAIGLPLLPNHAIDPWGGFNPREVWLFTLLSATISFMGYVAVRVLGSSRGLLVGGLVGAVVSSTAVTASFGQKARSGEEPLPLAGAASIAAVVALLRVLTVTLFISPPVFPEVVLPIIAAALIFAAGGAALMTKTAPSADEPVEPRNPFELVPLLIFAALFAVTATTGAALMKGMGHSSLIGISAASGIFDVDIAVLTALRAGDGAAPLQIVGDAVLVAVLANAGGRVLVAIASGTLRYWTSLAAISLVAAGTGMAVSVLIAR